MNYNKKQIGLLSLFLLNLSTLPNLELRFLAFAKQHPQTTPSHHSPPILQTYTITAHLPYTRLTLNILKHLSTNS